MRLWQIIVGVLMVLATVGGATAALDCSGTQFCDGFNASDSTYLWQYNNWVCSVNDTDLYTFNETAEISRVYGVDRSCQHNIGNKPILISQNPIIEVTLTKTNGHYAVILCNQSDDGAGHNCYFDGAGSTAPMMNLFYWKSNDQIFFYDFCTQGTPLVESSIIRYDNAVLREAITFINNTNYHINVTLDSNVVYDGILPICSNSKPFTISLASYVGLTNYDNVRVWYNAANCTENWLAQYSNLSCNMSDLMPELKTYTDLNTCGTVDDLPVDNGTISNVYACDWCVEVWTPHYDYSECFVNDTNYTIKYYTDLAVCNQTNELPVDNGTINWFGCDWCVENWAGYKINASCNISDLMNEFQLYVDLQGCNQTYELPVDNGTVSGVFACNYCSEDINAYFTAYGACVLPAKLQSRIRYYVDDNFAACCNVTSLVTDCNINNGSYANATVQAACSQRYDNRDLLAILGDGIGTTGASFVANLDLIVALLGLAAVVWVGVYGAKVFKK